MTPVPQEDNNVKYHPNGKVAERTTIVRWGERDWPVKEIFDEHGQRSIILEHIPNKKLDRSIYFKDGKITDICLNNHERSSHIDVRLKLNADGTMARFSAGLKGADAIPPDAECIFSGDKITAKYQNTTSDSLRINERQLLARLVLPIAGIELQLPAYPGTKILDLHETGLARTTAEHTPEEGTIVRNYGPKGNIYTRKFNKNGKTVIEEYDLFTSMEKSITQFSDDGQPESFLLRYPNSKNSHYSIAFHRDDTNRIDAFSLTEREKNGDVKNKITRIPIEQFGTQITVTASGNKNKSIDTAPLKANLEAVQKPYPIAELRQDVRTERTSSARAPRVLAPTTQAKPQIQYTIKDLGDREDQYPDGTIRKKIFSRTVDGNAQDYKTLSFRKNGTLHTMEELEPDGKGSLTYYFAGSKKDEEKPRMKLSFSNKEFDDINARLYMEFMDNQDRPGKGSLYDGAWRELEFIKNHHTRPITLDFSMCEDISEPMKTFIRAAVQDLTDEGKERTLTLAGIRSRSPKIRAKLERELAPLCLELKIKIRDKEHDYPADGPQHILTKREDYTPGTENVVYEETYSPEGEFLRAHVYEKRGKRPTTDIQTLHVNDISIEQSLTRK